MKIINLYFFFVKFCSHSRGSHLAFGNTSMNSPGGCLGLWNFIAYVSRNPNFFMSLLILKQDFFCCQQLSKNRPTRPTPMKWDGSEYSSTGWKSISHPNLTSCPKQIEYGTKHASNGKQIALIVIGLVDIISCRSLTVWWCPSPSKRATLLVMFVSKRTLSGVDSSCRKFTRGILGAVQVRKLFYKQT